MSVALERLRRLARKRVPQDEHALLDYVRPQLGQLVHDDWLVPESFSLGYHTAFWEELSESERYALNHWVFAYMYSRIADGEEYVLQANATCADYLRPYAPLVADLLDRENREERDHIAAFGAARDAIHERLGIGGIRFRGKPARKLLISSATTRSLLKMFGTDFVVAYFVGRGVANHMGKGFEAPVGELKSDKNRGWQRMSLLHTLDESHHMAVSRLLAAAAPEVCPAARARRGPYARMVRRLNHTLATYVFSEAISKPHERRMAYHALPQVKALQGRSPGFLRALIDAHFDGLSGVERSRNHVMGRPNRKLIEESALSVADKQVWVETLAQNQGNLRFFDAAPVLSAPAS